MKYLTDKELDELAEGVANLQWLAKHGDQLLEAILKQEWPKREVENGK